MLDLYPKARWTPSPIDHPRRPMTLGIVIHWTAGREAGDLATLRGGSVDCQFYVPRDATTGEAGKPVYQLLDPDEVGWHGFRTANTYCIGIECEGSGEPWAPEQYDAIVELVAWCCKRYSIPVLKVDPSGRDLSTFRGIFGHRDLSLGGDRVDGNNHTDTVPDGIGWGPFLARVRAELDPGRVEFGVDPGDLPFGGSLRLVVAGKVYAGWDDAVGPMRWIDRKGVGPDGLSDPDSFITWKGSRWNGPEKVLGVTRHLLRKYKL